MEEINEDLFINKQGHIKLRLRIENEKEISGQDLITN